MKGVVIKIDGSSSELAPANGRDFTLEELQAIVGGYIQIIDLNKYDIMVMDEDGKRDKEENFLATFIAHRDGAIMPCDHICGDVLVCAREMVK